MSHCTMPSQPSPPSYPALGLVTNDRGQALILNPDGWPDEPPHAVSLTPLADVLALRLPGGRVLGFLDAEHAADLALAEDVFLGSIETGRMVSIRQVVLSWVLAGSPAA